MEHRSATVEKEEDFGLIRPSLLKQLRSILDQYPDNGQILKELLQNAEDAGAHKVQFVYDQNSFAVSKLHHPDMAAFQGPALYAYNDALFTERDWTGIRMLQDSIKETDSTKIGRFGLGFKSVFHLTDLPSVLSGERLFFIDPHERYFLYQGNRTSGFMWNMAERKSDVGRLADQLAPFVSGICGSTNAVLQNGNYRGTLFRFPLRSAASELSATIYDESRVWALLRQFESDARLLLVFLKNVECIEVSVRHKGMNDSSVYFRVEIAPGCIEHVRNCRQQLIDAIRSRASQTVSTTYPIAIEIRRFSDDGSLALCRTHRYLVNELYAGGKVSQVLSELRGDSALALVPVVGTAIELEDEQANVLENKKSLLDENCPESEESKVDVCGLVFCSLPLAAQEKSPTGFPVHVNGYFAVSHNRSHLKWPSVGQPLNSDKCLMWNHCLISELIPVSYRDLILFARMPEHCKPRAVYNALPDLIKVHEKWQIVLEPLYHDLLKLPIFSVVRRNNVTQWMKLADSIFDRLYHEDPATRSVIVSVLTECDIAIASEVPSHVIVCLGAYGHAPEIITPCLVRSVLRCNPTAYKKLPRSSKLALLSFMMKDGDFRDLDGLELLPLASGEFIRLSCGQAAPVYLATEQFPATLLPTLTSSLIGIDDGDEHLKYKMEKMAREGASQVRLLSKEVVSRLLPKAVPDTWYKSFSFDRQPSSVDFHPANWLPLIWKFLRDHYPSTLIEFHGLPILPVICGAEVRLVQISTESAVVLRSGAGSTVSPNLEKTLELILAVVADDLPQYVRDHAAVVGNYVKLPIADDLVEVMHNATRHSDINKVVDMIRIRTSEAEKADLRELVTWIKPNSMESRHRAFLQRLPIFRCSSVEARSDEKADYCSVAEVGRAAPVHKVPLPVREKYILVAGDDVATKAAGMLGVKFMNITSVLSETLRQDLQKGFADTNLAESFAHTLFENVSSYIAEDPGIVDVLAKVPFVPIRQLGCFKAPSSLLDPEVPELVLVAGDSDVFPTGFCAKPENLISLRRMGLRSLNQLTASDLLLSMISIEKLGKSSDTQAAARKSSLAVLRFLDTSASLLWEEVDGRLLVEWASSLCWVAPVLDRPSFFPPSCRWCSSDSDSVVYMPGAVCSEEWLPVVGAVMPVVSCSADVSQAFGWNSCPSYGVIAQQLAALSSAYRSAEKVQCLTVVSSIYNILSEMDCQQLLAALQASTCTTWLWYGDGFTSVRRLVVKKPSVSLQPYVYALPSEMSPFTEFFMKCGVKTVCTAEVFIRVLHEIRDKYIGDQYAVEEVPSDTHLAISILNELANCGDLNDVSDLLIVCQFNEQESKPLVLLPVCECTYCDIDWLRRGFDVTEFNTQDGIQFIHPQLPVSTAAKLGVPTLMSRMLHAEELAVTSFGQSEPLTNRLHKLLEDYTDGLAIPKEIVQNADDAGASEVRFIYDERTNDESMKYLIDEGMRHCQGPALWAFNDAVFTDKDFESIIRLGGAVKESDLDKIGRFGLGFNSVYNITDVPSFVTRNILVIFDPHTTHLGRGIRDRSRPGIRINLDQNRMLLRRLPDQFQPYEDIFGCRLSASDRESIYFNGTLFRLPLRTREQASKSEISSLHYDHGRVLTLLELLAENAHNMLLFTQNVRKLTVYHIPPNGCPSEPALLFSIVKSIPKIIRPLSTTADWMKKLTVSCVVTEQDSELSRNCGILHAAAEYARLAWVKKAKGNNLVKPCCSMVIKVEVKFDNATAAGLGLQSNDSADSYWLVSSRVGSHKSLELALSRLKSGLVPVASVACQLVPAEGNSDVYMWKSLGHGISSGRGRAFCFMPLPVPTGLPVHVNSVFALDSNRRQLSRLTEDERLNVSVEWNHSLLKDSVMMAYAQMLIDLKSIIPVDADIQLNDIWPMRDMVDSYFSPLVDEFYNCVQSDKIPLAYRQGRPVTLQNVVFLDQDLASSSAGTAAEEVLASACGGKVVSQISNDVYKSFIAVGLCDAVRDKLYNTERFYVEIFFPRIGETVAEQRDLLVLFAIKHNSEKLDEFLKNVACIPSSPSGSYLCRPRDLIHPSSNSARLYDPDDGRFPHGSCFLDEKVISALIRLGMTVDELSWNDVIERCCSLQKTWSTNRQLGKSRQRILMLFLDRLLLRSTDNELMTSDIQSQLLNLPILSVQPKPTNFPLNWVGDPESSDLLCAAEMFPPGARYLVSATCCIVDDTGISARLQDFLHLNDNQPKLEHVVIQLEHALIVDVANLNAPQYTEFQLCVNAIYTFIQDQCKEDQGTAVLVSKLLSDRPCILIGKSFQCTDQVAVEFPYNCAPYLYGLPSDTASRFGHLMSTLGVKRNFDIPNYIDVLHKLDKKNDGKPLSQTELDIAVRMTSLINGKMKQSGTSSADVERSYGAILVPNSVGVLQPAASLCYNDCPWLDNAKLVSFVHSDITFQTSSLLGIPTKRQEALRQYSRGIPFGQKERLTNSLRRLLDSYPFDHEILKELIQNADDAGATQIHFVLDRRVHSDARVFESSWRPLQGPALCVYNNAPFLEKDLDGIQRFGEGSKMQDPTATGQYGIGFSSVYHLTDVPSLLATGSDGAKMLCVFDPMCRYVPGASVSEPGMRYDNIDALRSAFPDVFSCYMEEQFSRGGTIFRLPLRTRAMAEVSDISKTVVGYQRVQTILDMLKEEAFEILLFTNCLEEFSISEIDPATGSLSNTYTIKLFLNASDNQLRRTILGKKRIMSDAIKSDVLTAVAEMTKPENMLVTALVTDNRGCQEKWIISSRLGFDCDFKLPPEIFSSFGNGELALMPQGGVACLVERRLHGRIDGASRPNRAFCFLPLPVETDLPVHVNGHFALGYENRRHLWTNSDSGSSFKRQWNDVLCEAVVAPAYVELLRVLRTQGLSYVVVSDEQFQIQCSRPVLDSALKAYMTFFPCYSSTKPQWDVLSTAVYRRMQRDSVPLLVSVSELDREDQTSSSSAAANAGGSSPVAVNKHWQLFWFPPITDDSHYIFFRKAETAPAQSSQKQASLLGKVKNWFGMFPAQSAERSTEEILEEVLLGCGLKLVESTPELYENFHRAGIQIDYMTAESVLAFFESHGKDDGACNLGSLPLPLEKTPFQNEKTLSKVFDYVASVPDFYDRINGLPLLLRADNTLDCFSSKNQVYLSEYSELVPNCGNLFTKWTSFPRYTGTRLLDLDVFRDLDVVSLGELLPSVLPQSSFCVKSGFISWRKHGPTTVPTANWVTNLWSFVRKHWKRISDDESLSRDEKLEHFRDLLIPLKDWCVVPAQSGLTGCLYSPAAAARLVIDLQYPPSEHRVLASIIRSMKFPELDAGMLGLCSSLDREAVSCIAVTLDRPCELLTLIHSYLADANNKTVTLVYEQCNQLLTYFNKNIDSLSSDDTSADKLRDLPIFKTIYGDIIRLTGCFVYTLPEKIPTNGIDVWQNRSGTVFLACNDSIQPLYSFIGCASVSPLDVYCRFIFQHFEYFPKDDRLVHLHHVNKQYLQNHGSISVEERESLIESLRQLAFLEDENGELQPASYFYDPENVLFSVMLPNSRFAPRAELLFRESEWREFLIRLGMVTDVSGEKFLEFTRQISAEGQISTSSANTLTKSKVLTQYLLKNPGLLQDPVIDDVASIPFLVPEAAKSNLRSLHTQYGDCGNDRLPQIAFKDAVSCEHEQICWTSANLLPSWACPQQLDISPAEQEWIGNRLKIQQKPQMSTVLRHLKNLCTNDEELSKSNPAKHSNQLLAVKTDVFKAVYRFLCTVDLDDETRESLVKLPCVLVDAGRESVLARQTVVNMYDTDEIQPYLYRLPLDLGEFRRLFLCIGATDRATVTQYIDVLQRIHRESGTARLTPNELFAAYKAVRGFLESFESAPQSIRNVDGSASLYLPTEDGRLAQAVHLVFNDKPAFYDRVRGFNLRFVTDLRETGVKIRADDTLAALPAHLRPALLSTLVHETLVEACRRSVSERRSSVAVLLSERLRSEQFLHAVVRLIRHEAHKSGQPVDNATMYGVLDRLSTIRVYGAPNITTHLVLKGKPIPGSEVERPCFVEKVATAIPDVHCWNIFVRDDSCSGRQQNENSTLNSLSQELLISLAEVINNILSRMLHDSVLYLLPALSCPSADSIDACLDGLNVRVDHTLHRSSSSSSTTTTTTDLNSKKPRAGLLPQVGSPISDELKSNCRHVKPASSVTFRPGEYIGYSSCDVAGDSAGNEIIYGTVIEELESPEKDERLYLLDLGSGQNGVIASSRRMFQFIRN